MEWKFVFEKRRRRKIYVYFNELEKMHFKAVDSHIHARNYPFFHHGMMLHIFSKNSVKKVYKKSHWNFQSDSEYFIKVSWWFSSANGSAAPTNHQFKIFCRKEHIKEQSPTITSFNFEIKWLEIGKNFS